MDFVQQVTWYKLRRKWVVRVRPFYFLYVMGWDGMVQEQCQIQIRRFKFITHLFPIDKIGTLGRGVNICQMGGLRNLMEGADWAHYAGR